VINLASRLLVPSFLAAALLPACVVQAPPAGSTEPAPPPAESGEPTDTATEAAAPTEPATDDGAAPQSSEAPTAAPAVTRQARSGDVASEYQLESDGDLFRVVNGQRCQVTSGVADIKISQHPRDPAMLYFVKGRDLVQLQNAETTGTCPKASTTVVATDLATTPELRYSVVPTTRTSIVAMALSTTGEYRAWSPSGSLSFINIRDYQLNPCYGVSGKGHSSYVAFLLDNDGRVTRLKGNESKASKSDDAKTYADLAAFADQNKVCR
jgi:hypothetical protein